MPTAEILSQGDEVVTGQVADTNAAYMSERLTELGVTVVRHTAVSDRLTHIRDTLREAAGRTSLAICTGGLGPTDDDLTAQAVAEAFDRPLVLRDEALAQIRSIYARFDRPMPPVNRKQALLPAGSTLLANRWGTAPAFAFQESGTWFVFLAGVPREMRALFQAYVVPMVLEHLQPRPMRLVTLRTAGIGESNLQQRLQGFEHPEVSIGYRSVLPENHVKLTFEGSVPEHRVRNIVEMLSMRIGSPLFSIEGLDPDQGGDLATVVGRTLGQHSQTVSTAESCTGGRVAALFTGVAGSSAWFLSGAVTYSNAAKVAMLGVSAEALDAQGAVSEVIARQMAAGARERAQTTWALSTTGIAGPGGGTEDKPVGLVHIALAGPDGTDHRTLRLGGDRNRIQILAAAAALDLLRRHLQDIA